MTKKSRIVHANFRCNDCPKEWQNYENARAAAASHARYHSHKVTGEVATYLVYDFRNGDDRT